MASQRPNLLLINVDHWPGTHPPTVSGPIPQTPTLRQLAALGTNFTRAYSACPVCIAARRTLMTGMTARSHGDRCFDERGEMPDAPTLAQCLADSGYQTYAVGKLHVYPRRNRIGFDEVILNEEGRRHLINECDDWEAELAAEGYAGMEYSTGVNNNDYVVVPWHLPDHLHPTNWAARHMSRAIQRRDPERPAFWYLSFVGPHPPLWPLRWYYDLYRDLSIEEPLLGEWVGDWTRPPYKLRAYQNGFTTGPNASREEILAGLRGFHAAQTHIDHQIRVVLGTLREQGQLNNTAIVFTSDHGDMLGHHGLWAKTVMYENSARIPLLIVPPQSAKEAPRGVRDDRLAELRDIMPTLLNMAGAPIPETVEGMDLLGTTRRESLYGEHDEGLMATRMLIRRDHKLIYYPDGNRFQLFDLKNDPKELKDLADDTESSSLLETLKKELAGELYDSDLEWLEGGEFRGLPEHQEDPPPAFGLRGQRGLR